MADRPSRSHKGGTGASSTSSLKKSAQRWQGSRSPIRTRLDRINFQLNGKFIYLFIMYFRSRSLASRRLQAAFSSTESSSDLSFEQSKDTNSSFNSNSSPEQFKSRFNKRASSEENHSASKRSCKETDNSDNSGMFIILFYF